MPRPQVKRVIGDAELDNRDNGQAKTELVVRLINNLRHPLSEQTVDSFAQVFYALGLGFVESVVQNNK